MGTRSVDKEGQGREQEEGGCRAAPERGIRSKQLQTEPNDLDGLSHNGKIRERLELIVINTHAKVQIVTN